MLQNIRDNLTGKIALAVLGVIALSFVFVGGANFATIGSNYAAKVDDAEVSLAAFENAYRDQLQRNPQLASLPPAARQQMRSNLLEQLIQQQVIDNYLDEAGYRISDEQLTAAVHQIPDFQLDGRFDRDTYESVLALNGIAPLQFEESQRLSLRRAQLQRAIRGSSVVSPSGYRRYLNLAFENRLVTTATIDAEMVAEQINITEDMVVAYYDGNPQMFNLPETADIQYVEINRDDVASDASVTEQELLDYYDINQSQYLQDEQRQARHILILFDGDESGAEAVANEVLTRIRAGESFETLAAEFSKDGATASNGGDLGALTREQLPDALGDEVFLMRQGDIQGPVKGDFGYHIVRLDQIFDSGPLPFEQVRASILSEVQIQKADSLFRDLTSELSSALFSATDISEIATAVGAEVQTLAGFSRDGSDEFADSQEVVDAVFDARVLNGSQISDLVEIDDSRTAVFAVTQHNEASRESLDAVRPRIITSLTANQSVELMAERAQQILDAVEGGQSVADAAAAAGATAAEPAIMTRTAEDGDQSLAVAVFTAVKPEQGSPTLGTTRNDAGGYTVYSIGAVIPGRPQAIPQADRDAGKLQLTDSHGIGDFVAFVQALRADADIVINNDALAAQDLFQ